MFSSEPLRCYFCNSVILNLTKMEMSKFTGLNFTCECCGHLNLLQESKFYKGTENEDPYLNILSMENAF